MNKTTKIILIITISLAFIGSAVGSPIADKTNLKKEPLTKKVTLYRYGPDGSITPINVDVEIGEEQDIGEVLADKCNDLFENDIEMQNLLQNIKPESDASNLALRYGLLFVKSHGRGFHFKTKNDIIGIKGRLLFKIIFPKIDLIFCNYQKDPRAKTTITPIILNNLDLDATKYIEGSHSVLVHHFRGYTTWIGRLSYSIILPRAFCGISRLVVCNKLS